MNRNMKKIVSLVMMGIMTFSNVPNVSAEEKENVILHYDFDGAIENGINYGADIKHGYAYFDGVDDYVKLPDNIISGEEKVTFVINVRPEMDGANQFTFTVGTGENNYLFLNTNNGSNMRFAMTNVGWWQEEGELRSESAQKSEWTSVAIVIDKESKKMYVDGNVVAETTSSLLASGLGDTNQNYIAKSQYAQDSYFKGYIDDFAIYSDALSGEEIEKIALEHENNSRLADLYIASENLEFESYNITENIVLPTEYEEFSVSWKSDNEKALSETGEVHRFDTDAWVNMSATFTNDKGESVERVYGFNVVHNYTDVEIATMDLDNIHLVGNLEHLKENLYLETESKYGSKIAWKSADTSVVTDDGKINRAPSGQGDKKTDLYVFCTYNTAIVSKKYEITVEEEDYAYLFAYFTGNRPEQERLFYGLSRDGYHFNAINGGNYVLESNKGHKCMRDPFIMKGQNGLYYAIMTDMRSWDGWSSQSSIIIFESADLINWDEGTLIDFNQFGWYNRAWAPQAIWDAEFYDEESGEYGAYMIYLALSSGGATQMYKVYTKDMKNLITEPEILYKRSDSLSDIDGDIIYKDGMYYMYVKDESNGGIFVVKSEKVGGPYSERINSLPANGAARGIEGSGIYKLMNEDKYNIVYDAYNDGFFIMTQTEDLVNFNQMDRSEYSFDFTPRHGYVITISKEEADRLEKAYGESIAEREDTSDDAIVYYDFEDDKDKSGNFFDAQLASSASIAQGISGGLGLYLSGNEESYAQIPSDAVKGLEDYTIAAWIKPESKENTQRVFDFGTDNQRYMFLTPYYAANTLRGAITAGSYTYEKGISVDCDIETDRWTHVAMQQEGDVMRIYIDGEKVGEAENVTLDPYEIKHTIPYCYIGKSMWSGDKYFNGTIDEFYIFDRAISEDEIKELYEKELKIACNISQSEAGYEVNFVRDGAKEEKFDVVIAQYDGFGILTKAEKKTVDFGENDTIGFEVEKSGERIRTFWFESVENLIPLKQ